MNDLAGVSDFPDYERIDRFIYGFQRTRLTIDSFLQAPSSSHDQSELASRARQVVEKFEAIVKEGIKAPLPELDATLQEAVIVERLIRELEIGPAHR